jgi:hypothetical protein
MLKFFTLELHTLLFVPYSHKNIDSYPISMSNRTIYNDNFPTIVCVDQGNNMLSDTTVKHKPKFTKQVPCKARGVDDKTHKHAVITIPLNPFHGQRLFCSHISCERKGRMFVYCFTCKKPVVKRNFRNKHMHHDRRDEATSSPRTASGDEETTESFSSSMTSMERSPNELRTVMQIRSTQNNEEETGTETPSIADEQIAKQASANCLEGSRYDNVMDDDAFLDGLLDPLFDEY